MSCGSPRIIEVSASLTRPSDTNNYADNDLVANSTTAGSVVPLSFTIPVGNGRGIKIVGAKLQKTGTAVTGATFDLLLFASSPTVTAGDNAAFATTAVNTSNYIGTIALPAMAAYTDDALSVITSGPQTGGFNPLYTYMRSTDTIYGLIQCAAAYTDEASGEVFTATLLIEQTD